MNCAPHLPLLLLCSVFLQNYSLRFCLFPSIFHVARYLSVIITHTPPPPLVGKKLACLRPIHAYMHACIHTYIHRYIPSFHTPSFFLTYHLSHTFRSFTTSFVFPSFPVGMITSHKARRKSLQNLRLHSAEHYIQAYKHTCIHAYMHTCIHAYIHTYIHT